jgi:hypothetical protein
LTVVVTDSLVGHQGYGVPEDELVVVREQRLGLGVLGEGRLHVALRDGLVATVHVLVGPVKAQHAPQLA